MVDDDGPLTFRELRLRSDSIAGVFEQHLPFGASVGLLCRNHAACVAVLLASQRAGLRAVLLNPSGPVSQTLDAARALNLSLLVVDDALMPDLQALEPDLPCCCMSALTVASAPGKPGPSGRRQGRIVLLTSGTTGPAKVVQRRLESLGALRALMALLVQLNLRAHAPVLLTTPLVHGHGLATLAMSLAFGAPLHLRSRGGREAYLRTLRDARIEVLVLVPTVLYRLLDAPTEPLPHLRTVISGSAPLTADLARRALSRFGPVLFNLYGSSELGLISLAPPEQLLAAPDSVGRVLPGTRLSVRRADGTPAAANEEGNVTLRTAGHWQPTGDRGRLSESGLLTLTGRSDDLLVIGGVNVTPQRIEEDVARLPFVLDCAVTGVPCEEYGQRVVAFIVPRGGWEHVTAVDVQRELQALLPRAWRPSQVEFRAALPRNAMGKLVRHQLKPSEDQ